MLKKLYKKLISGQHTDNSGPSSIPKAYQQKFAARYAIDMDDYKRSFVKYLCRKELVFHGMKHKILLLCFNLVSFLIILPLFFFYFVKGKLISEQQNDSHNSAVILKPSSFTNIDDILPVEELKKYGTYRIVQSKKYSKGFIKRIALAIFLNCLKEHPFNFYYLLMILVTLADYNRVISKYNPKAIFSFADEKNFSKPIATIFCEQQGIAHIGFMHGEVYYQIDKGFCHYSKYMVWDSYYVDLFREMCSAGEIVTYTPERFSKTQYPVLSNYPVTLTYYESGNSEVALRSLAKVFAKLKENGFTCVLRPHPRSSDIKTIQACFESGDIEDYRVISIEDSLKRTKFAAAFCSTVLMEALFGGKTVVLDDITDKTAFGKIQEKGYIILNKQHILLSELLGMFEKYK